jgi:DNA mismatch endonuclease (patch repair protein)
VAKLKLAIYVDGCFWHGCPIHWAPPKRNTEYWTAKVERNKARDTATDGLLRSAGWTVVRVWEHEPLRPAAAAIVHLRDQLRRSTI